MEKLNILCVVGGIARNSLNRKLFKVVEELSPAHVTIRTFEINKLPFFSQDLENDPPDSVIRFKDMIRDADAVIFITPEYNRSIPGVLKNAVDWGSRPYGQNLWDRKPAGVMGATISQIGTFGAQHHLRQVLAYLNMSVMGQPEFYFNAANAFDDRGRLKNEKSAEFVQNYWSAFLAWIERVGDKKAPMIEGTFPATGQEDSPYAH
ncbi:MAG: NAD(P)H-dependent oxidoreductase [Bdellovibrionota bacterium]